MKTKDVTISIMRDSLINNIFRLVKTISAERKTLFSCRRREDYL